MAGKPKGGGRQLLIDAALDCIAEYGYHRSSVREIARIAGVTAGLLRYYFPGKSELMAEAYRHYLRNVLMTYFYDATSAGPDPVNRLEAFTRAVFSVDPRCPNKMKIWTGFLELVLTDPEVSSERLRMYDLYLQEIGNCVAEIHAGREEAIAPERVRQIAVGIESLFNGLWLECSLHPSRMSPENALEIALDFMEARLDIRFSGRVPTRGVGAEAPAGSCG